MFVTWQQIFSHHTAEQIENEQLCVFIYHATSSAQSIST